MMKRIKGFTLVELLAVIVVLAVILIIAVPGILGIINKTKENAYQSQLSLIKDTARTYVTTTRSIWTDDTVVVSLSDLQDLGMLDKKLIDPRDKSEMKGISVLVTRLNNRMKYELVYSDSSNANYPVLSSGMIPIRYDGTNWVKADYKNEDHSWFDYSKQNWANIATVTSDVRDSLIKANIGTVVPMDKINTMFVWIPRFNYKLFNVDGTVSPIGNPNLVGDYTIDIGFENKDTKKSNGTKNGEWLTHPAFTFGEKELTGFWVAKFEAGFGPATTTEEAEQNVVDSTKLVVKPGVYSWRGIAVKNMYQNSRNVTADSATFGFTEVNDSHMIKNMEWGAMAFLSSSIYGKAGNPDYTGGKKEVQSNNNSTFLTGYGMYSSYETSTGQTASTTGNITGIYDTNGGNDEYVAALMNTSSGGYSGYSTGFTKNEVQAIAEEGKYLEFYEFSDTQTSIDKWKIGDASKEMGPFTPATFASGLIYYRAAWYDDFNHYVYNSSGVVRRGLGSGNAERSGIFSNASDSGGPYKAYGFRFVVI